MATLKLIGIKNENLNWYKPLKFHDYVFTKNAPKLPVLV
jgi:hypothetical protein